MCCCRWCQTTLSSSSSSTQAVVVEGPVAVQQQQQLVVVAVEEAALLLLARSKSTVRFERGGGVHCLALPATVGLRSQSSVLLHVLRALQGKVSGTACRANIGGCTVYTLMAPCNVLTHMTTPAHTTAHQGEAVSVSQICATAAAAAAPPLPPPPGPSRCAQC